MSCSQITKLADADRVFLSEFLNKQQGSPKGSKNKNMAAIEGPPFFCHADTRAALFQRAALTNERPLQLAGNVHHDGLLPTRPRRLFFSFFCLTVVSVIQQDVRRPQVVNRPHRKLLFERWLSVSHLNFKWSSSPARSQNAFSSVIFQRRRWERRQFSAHVSTIPEKNRRTLLETSLRSQLQQAVHPRPCF